MLRDPQIQTDPEAARRKWRRRQGWALVVTAAALFGALVGGGNELVVAVIIALGMLAQSICRDFAGSAWLASVVRGFFR
jgi:hypothetical protein